MALTVNTAPDEIASVYIPLCWDITTDTPGTVKKLRVEWLISSNVVAKTVHLPTIGTTDNYIIDGANIASNFVTYDIADTYGVGGSITFNSFAELELNIYEVDAAGDDVPATGITTDLIYAQNIPIQYNQQQDLLDKLSSDNTSCYLSKRPQKSTAYKGEFIPIHTITAGGNSTHILIEKFIGGVSVDSDSFDSIVSGSRGVYYIDTTDSFYDDAEAITFKIWENDFQTTEFSKLYTIKLKENCDDFCELHFLNCLGGFDSFTFTGDKTTSFNVTRKRFKGSLGKSFDIKDRGQSVLGTKSVKEIELFSRFLNESESEMLTDLIHSPEVFIIEDNNFIPVVVKDGNYTTKTNKGLIQYKIILEYANNKKVACV